MMALDISQTAVIVGVMTEDAAVSGCAVAGVGLGAPAGGLSGRVSLVIGMPGG
jgi:hypothetical protein